MINSYIDAGIRYRINEYEYLVIVWLAEVRIGSRLGRIVHVHDHVHDHVQVHDHIQVHVGERPNLTPMS